MIIYVAELAFRIVGDGLAAFNSGWVRFDFVLVVCGLLDNVLRRITIDDAVADIMSIVMVGRLMRLVRMARLVRLLVQFKVLWLLVSGMLASFQTLLWTFVMCCVSTYIFALFALELIVPGVDKSSTYNEIAETNFGSLLAASLTLLAGLTLDSFAAVYTPLIMESPFLAVFFLPFMLVNSIALMNLVTALMVENSLSQANEDMQVKKAWEHQKRTQLLADLKCLFDDLDKDHSRTLELKEIMSEHPGIRQRLLHVLGSDDPEELKKAFHDLDFDGSGKVGIDEFLDGLMMLADGKPHEITAAMLQVFKTQTAEMHRILTELAPGSVGASSNGSLLLASRFLQSNVNNKQRVKDAADPDL